MKDGGRLISRIALSDNVCLNALQSDKFKTGCFSVNFLRPLQSSEAAQNALISGVLLAGCRPWPDIRSISIRLDELYGASVGTLVRKKGAVQSVGFYADFVEDALAGSPVLAPLTGLVRALLLEPCTEQGGFRSDYFATERNNLINSMRAALNNKQSYANLRLLKTMFRGEPYGVPANGEEADLDGVDALSLYGQYERLLTESRVELFYHGRLAPEAAAELFRAMFSGLPQRQIAPLTLPENHPVVSVKSESEAMPLAQSKLSMGFRAPQARSADSLAAMLVFAVLYGSGSNSKLFLNVREAKSLCYYAGASYDKYQGVMRVASGIAAEACDAAQAEILHQLDECVQGNFSEAELGAAKRLLQTQLLADLDSPGRLDEYWLGQAILGESYGLQELIEAVERVQRQDVIDAAAGVKLDTVFFLKGVGE